ncbi:esterase-like activity of phytase family protein [Roseateles sp. DAIF2]|uniref:esterase-like activity of phytase family protein n=1 Tax=Roseateles sp. DAIF2 TaxID=2714952 RepID=UPI0018A2CDF1|nr:esterase-like activity of phytase family protein [Roseateles sp. DAIF2]QPF74757.1 esterase-like activity of phytase family protein [Roseateles sp. DAIF2]
MPVSSPIRTRQPRATALALLLLASGLLLSACGGGDDDDKPAEPEISVASLRLIGQQVLPRRLVFQDTVVGGLSGIDYDAKSDSYVLISDDRTTGDSPNAPRLYTAKLSFDANQFSGVQFLSTIKLKQPDGSDYPKVPDIKVADPEAVRIDPVNGNYVWVSEGERTLGTPNRLIQPFIREVNAQGQHQREYTLPAMFQMNAGDSGPRHNAVFEGLSFTPDGRSAVVLMEGPLLQDGAAPSLTAGAQSRITVFDRASGQATAQYAYPVEKVQATPVPANNFSVSGATEILALSATRFLVLERSFSVGVVGNQVRLYEIDTAKASNVLSAANLAGATPVTKRLVLDFETLKTTLGGIANLEGLSFGPKLANGKRSLVVVADDNFPTADSPTDRNQILVFEIQP